MTYKQIGFIGTGVMGRAIVKHLLHAGYAVHVYTRTKEKAQELLEIGAKWCDTPAEIASVSQVIFTMVGYPSDVEEVYFGENGIFSTLAAGKIVVDLTTSTPTLAKEIAARAEQIGCVSLDAPVSGGDLGAQNGTLSVMVGGDASVLESIRLILLTFAKAVGHHGDAGAGQHAKMANQIMIAGTMTGLCEMLVYAEAMKLDLVKVIETVGAGSGSNWSLLHYGPRILREDYSPGFFAKHFLKDLSIALDEAEKMNLFLPATLQAKKFYQTLCDDGYGDDGTQALIKLWWFDSK